MSFIKQALCEKDGSPSSTRINLLILLLFTLGLISAAFIVARKLPEIPTSLADLIKFLFGVATAKVALGSGVDLVAAIKGVINGKAETTDQQPVNPAS